MFRTLRLKLTLINILIMGFLLLLFVTGTYFLMEHQIFTQSERLMRNIALAIESESAEKLSQYEKTEYFYVITNAAGDITQTFFNNPRSDLKELPELVHKIFAKGKDRGDFDWHDRSHTFLKVPHKQGPGFLVIFLSIERDMEVLSFLLAALSIAGILCLALAFYSSLFLADKALIPIRKSWQRQRDFVADASHELRTPLAVMQTNLELVMGNPNETVADQEIWLKNVQTEISHMTRLVEDLLLLARIDSEQQLLELSRFSLDQAIYDVIKPIIPMAETKGIKLRLEIEPQVEFNGDEKRIKQLVVILIDNAIKHTPAGGEVALKMANRGSSVEITVSDTGEGIEPEHLEKIFERFYRIDKARSKSGTGLGLSIADWIVKSHHGSIKVKSSPGKGTTFMITLQNRP
ncbi:sensor histidine kinase [Desulfotomaculum nigrificans]|uniref:sensor histidine kinase n=1 Tax=Desulfotomaculum nigrificans TaxID=1565 RepID=UPI0002FDE08F|nr:ATP-binding protein [Desulfotomaculum nigrificans]